MNAADQVRRLLGSGGLDLPPVGAGNTRERWRRLAAIARCDVSTARLAEAHVDGIQILRDARRSLDGDRLVGVWASEAPQHHLRATVATGRVTLHGSKAFCGGAGIVDDALVTAATDAGPTLFLVPCESIDRDRIDTTRWRAPGLRDTSTATIDFDGVVISTDAQVGGAGWYLDRPGFWHGAIGPAACWAGAAEGLVDYAVRAEPVNPHARAHLGALIAASWSIATALDAAGDTADCEPENAALARRRALIVRYLVDERCGEIQDRFGRAFGPRPLVEDAAIVERFEALTIYRRQCHAERDLEQLAGTTHPEASETAWEPTG